MSARMDAPLECACDELEAHRAIEMMVRGLMEQQQAFPLPTDRNQINTGYRLVFMQELAKLDAVRTINQAQEAK